MLPDRYITRKGEKLRLTAERDHSMTTLLFPEES
jgi:hypothetical protein